MDNSFKTQFFPKGKLIIKEGESGENAYIINQGQVEVTKTTIYGNSITIATMEPGEIFGEMCLLDNQPRSANVIATTDVILSVINKEDFLCYMKDTPIQVKIIINLLLKRLRETSNLVTELKLDNITPKE